MKKKSPFLYVALVIIGPVLLTACSGAKKDTRNPKDTGLAKDTGFEKDTGFAKDTGYSRIKDPVSKDSADKVKNRFKEIDNESFVPNQYTGVNNITIRYRLLSPAVTRPEKNGSSNPNRQEKEKEKDKYPLVLVLHGSGAVGTDNISQMGILAKLWAQPSIRKKYPAYIVVPQFPQRSSNYTPSPEKKVLVSTPAPCLTTALQLIDSLKKVLSVDEKKIYVIGFSMGGSGTINALDLRPDLFAAGISISGIPDFKNIPALSKTPIWLIHGNADHENPIGGDSLLYKELTALPEHHLKFWEIENLDHAIYSELYTSDLIPRWLFRQKK